MTRRRHDPDLPRVCTEAAFWAVTAKVAGADIWQIAVYTQYHPHTLYKLLRRNGRAGLRRYRRTPTRAAA